tara:strand:+ start:721 stop:1116 length:396 start_codon:yes stop_codon:yes gene_type:complete
METRHSPILTETSPTGVQLMHEGSYEHQRKFRMQDAIDDYLQDDKVSARQAYEEIISCIQDVIDVHGRVANRAEELRCLMSLDQDFNTDAYYRKDIKQEDPVYNDDGTTSYGYAAHITLGDVTKFQRGSSL